MRGFSNLLAAIVLALGVPLTVMGCEGALSTEAETEAQLTLEAIQASVNLSGTWALNEEESDEPGPQREGASPHGMGSPPGGPPEPSMADGGLMAPDMLTIEQVDGHVTLTDGNGRSRTLHPNGEWTGIGSENGTMQVRSNWEQNALRVEIRNRRGELTRTYELADGGTQLLITSRIEDGPRGGTVELTRVYDRATTD